MRDDRGRLADILEAIERIAKYASQGRETFLTDELVQNWVINHIQIIGEAARALSAGFKEKHPELPWSEIVGMRNILVHDYFGINLDEVWNVVERDLPEFKHKIEAIMRETTNAD